MRIAYVVHKYPPESVGGTEICTWGLARSLAAMGNEVHVFYPLFGVSREQARIERDDNVRLWRVPLAAEAAKGNPISQFWHTFRNETTESEFTQFLDQIRPDIVHFQHVQGVSAKLIAMAERIPRIVSLHDYWYFCPNSQLLGADSRICDGSRFGWDCVACATKRRDLRWLRALCPLLALAFIYRNWYLRRVLHNVDLFLTPSEFVRLKYIEQGFPASKIVEFQNGLDVSRLAPTGVDLPSSVSPHFGFLGSIAWQKGLHVLVEAFNQLPSSASLTIYGDDTLFPEYSARVKAMIRHSHIRFAGALDYRYIGDALRQLDFLVVPSLWCESYGMVVQEAHAVGVPVVASNLGALRRIQDGENGRLFEAGNSADLALVLQDLIDHPEKRKLFCEKLSPGPTIKQQAERVLEIYRRVIERETGMSDKSF